MGGSQNFFGGHHTRLAREPGTPSSLKSGNKNIAIIAPSFASDCVETLEEICGEISESFIEAGGKNFLYIPCLNDDKVHINMLFNILKKELSGWI